MSWDMSWAMNARELAVVDLVSGVSWPSARVAAQALGVDESTVREWVRDPVKPFILAAAPRPRPSSRRPLAATSDT